MSARDLTHFHNISWYSSLRHSTIHLITDDSTLALAQKSEDQHETNFQCNGYNFIKTSVIQHTPFKRPMEGIFEMPDFEVKTEIFNENIKIEPDAEDFLPTSSNLKNEVSVGLQKSEKLDF